MKDEVLLRVGDDASYFPSKILFTIFQVISQLQKLETEKTLGLKGPKPLVIPYH